MTISQRMQGELSPLTWIATNLLLLGALTRIDRPLPLAVAVVLFFVAGLYAAPDRGAWIRGLAPYLWVSLGWFASSALFAGPEAVVTGTRWISMGPVNLSGGTVAWASVRVLRLLAMVSFGALALLRIRPERIAPALGRVGVDDRVGFAVQTAVALVPALKADAVHLRRARRVRGVPPVRGMSGGLREWRALAIPLLSAAVRRADRLAMSVESRGFGAVPRRAYRRHVRVAAIDALSVALFALLLWWLTQW